MAAILADYSAVIFDEAHDLEDIATEYFGVPLAGAITGLRNLFTTRPSWKRTLSSSRASERYFNGFALLREGQPSDLENLDEIDGLIEARLSQDARISIKQKKDFAGQYEGLARRAVEIADELEVFRSGPLETYVSWIERRGRGLFLEACPIDVSGMLQMDCSLACPHVVTSATLTVAGGLMTSAAGWVSTEVMS